MTYWTATLKPRVLGEIEKAGITNKEAIKCILKLNKSVNTTCGLINNGMNWESVSYSDSYMTASDCFDKLSGNTYGKTDAKFWKEWVAYCEASGTAVDSDLGDWLC